MSAFIAIHPVIMPVCAADQALHGRPKVAALRAQARQALAQSADYAGVVLGALRKNAQGAPLPSNGIHWSLSHKGTAVAAVTASRPIGIDLEIVRPCNPGLYQRIADDREWALAGAVNPELFFRIWTAKEAVLKAVGQGLTGLSDCRIHEILDDTRMIITYENTIWPVVHRWWQAHHLVAVTANHDQIIWHLPE